MIGALSLGLTAVMVIAVAGMMWNRIKTGRGISWEIIRFNAICIALPLVGVLALSEKLDQASTAIIASVLGYAFGKTGERQAEMPGSGEIAIAQRS